jgi:hypothetical protein
VTAGGHGVAVDLGLDVDELFCVGFEPRDVNLDVKVAYAGGGGVSDGMLVRIN